MQAAAIVKLLRKALDDRVKKLGADEGGDGQQGEPSDYAKLLDTVKTLQTSIVDDAKTEISAVEDDITSNRQRRRER